MIKFISPVFFILTLFLLSIFDTPNTKDTLNVGETFIDCEACPEMVVIPAGQFKFGSPPNEPYRMPVEEGPQYEVRVPYLAVSITEVTEYSWSECIKDGMCIKGNKSAVYSKTNKFPVTDVSWDDINAKKGYLKWLNSKSKGALYRLPSEAEWEYFARAGEAFPFRRKYQINSDEANFRGTEKFLGRPASDYRGTVIEVGSLPPNDFGLYDVQGNVLEWTADCWFETLADYKLNQKSNCDHRGLRGGSWLDEPNSLRFAFRRGYDKTLRTKNIGFRVVKNLDQEKVVSIIETQTHYLDLTPTINGHIQQLNTLGKKGCRADAMNGFQVRLEDCVVSSEKEN